MQQREWLVCGVSTRALRASSRATAITTVSSPAARVCSESALGRPGGATSGSQVRASLLSQLVEPPTADGRDTRRLFLAPAAGDSTPGAGTAVCGPSNSAGASRRGDKGWLPRHRQCRAAHNLPGRGLPRRRAKFGGLRWRVERVRPADSWTWAPGRHVAPRAPGGPLLPVARGERLTDGRRRGAHRRHAAGAALRPPSSLAGELSRRRAKPLLRLRPPNCARLREPPPAAGRRVRRAAEGSARGAAAARRGTLEAHLPRRSVRGSQISGGAGPSHA
jgi:hypothetical protein